MVRGKKGLLTVSTKNAKTDREHTIATLALYMKEGKEHQGRTKKLEIIGLRWGKRLTDQGGQKRTVSKRFKPLFAMEKRKSGRGRRKDWSPGKREYQTRRDNARTGGIRLQDKKAPETIM